MSLSIEPLGLIQSPYGEKFAVPRQPGLVTAARTQLTLIAPYNDPMTLEGIEQFSHLWLIFGFHHNRDAGWQSRVRPPRLGGNQKIGLFASRSTFRPNNLGLSVMKLIGIEKTKDRPTLIFEGGDLVNGTPVYDIKPYLPYADSLPEAEAGYAAYAPNALLEVMFQPNACQSLIKLAISSELKTLFIQVLSQDPRPAYRKGKTDDNVYGVALAGYNLRFQIIGDHCCHILQIEPL